MVMLAVDATTAELNKSPLGVAPVVGGAARPRPQRNDALTAFIRAQRLNTKRHVTSLRPFRQNEFAADIATPSVPHIAAANQLIHRLRLRLVRLAEQTGRAAAAAERQPSPDNLRVLLGYKDLSSHWVKEVERVWSFYLELFGQRQSRYGPWLVGIDRIALDCYQAIYTGLSIPRRVPSPPPFSYMATGFTPSTFRRGVQLSKLGQRANPFPIVQLPYHRIYNPWTLGAVHHEVSHNLQSDLGLWDVVPRMIYRRLRGDGLSPDIAGIWARWNKEIWADLCGLLLGGPAIIPSLMDVVAMAPRNAQSFNPDGVHPVPYVRVLINLELLRRMGFAEQAESYRRMWHHMYPSTHEGSITAEMRTTFDQANRLVVDTICFKPYPQLGNKGLADVTCFKPPHEAMAREAAERLARGTDPAIIPPRFLVAAARYAIEHQLAAPGQITINFYRALLRR